MMKLISKSSPQYARRMAREINASTWTHSLVFRLAGSPYDGRRILRAWTENGVLFGRSLSGEEFAINVECVFDGHGNQLCASREK